jgi:hypothetical protein
MLREVSDLSSGAIRVTHAITTAITEDTPSPAIDSDVSDRQFREMMYRRLTMPLEGAIPYRHWGINE